MSLFLTIAFLFFIGSMAGWVIEVVFRRFFSSAFRCWNNIYQSRIRRSGRRRCSP